MVNNYDLLVKRVKESSKRTKFFYELLHSEPSESKKNSDWRMFIFGIKFFMACGYFEIGNLYHSFISKITAYYPFSLLYKDRLFHHDNLKVNKFMIKLEKIAEKKGLKILVLTGGIKGNFAQLNGYLDPKVKNRQKVLEKLEALLQKKYENVYVRGGGEDFKILIPKDLFEEIISKQKRRV